jgi:hypothetical protein
MALTTFVGSGESYFSNRVKAELDENFALSSPNVVGDTTPQLGGNLDVNGKEIVSVSNGNVTVTPNGTGDVDLAKPILTSSTSSLSGAGAVPVTHSICELTTGAADALTLADGREGQHLYIVMISDGGDGTLTPTNPANFATLTFDNSDSAALLFTNGAWYYMGGNAAIA